MVPTARFVLEKKLLREWEWVESAQLSHKGTQNRRDSIQENVFSLKDNEPVVSGKTPNLIYLKQISMSQFLSPKFNFVLVLLSIY